jgi:hypothetical protein
MLAGASYDPGYLKSNTFYFWRVDAVNAAGAVYRRGYMDIYYSVREHCS